MKQKSHLLLILFIFSIIKTSQKNNLSLDSIPSDPLFSQCSFKNMLALSLASTFWNKQVSGSVIFFEKFFNYYDNKRNQFKNLDSYAFEYYPIAPSIFTIMSAKDVMHEETIHFKIEKTIASVYFTLSDSCRKTIRQSIKRNNNPFLKYLDKKIGAICNEGYFMWNQSFDEFTQFIEEQSEQATHHPIFTAKNIYFKDFIFDDYIILWLLKSDIFSSKVLTLYDLFGINIQSCLEVMPISSDWKNHLKFFHENGLNLKKFLKNNIIITKKLKKIINTFYWYDRFEEMELLLQSGADPNIVTKSNYPFLFVILEENEPQFLELFLEHGIHIHKELEAQLFKKAILDGQPEIIKLLLEYSPNKKQLIENTQNCPDPAIFLALRSHKSTVILKELFKHGFNPNVQDEQGNYPLKRAIQIKNTKNIRLLLNHGADVNAVLKNNVSFLCFSKAKAHKIKNILASVIQNIELIKRNEREYIFIIK